MQCTLQRIDESQSKPMSLTVTWRFAPFCKIQGLSLELSAKGQTGAYSVRKKTAPPLLVRRTESRLMANLLLFLLASLQCTLHSCNVHCIFGKALQCTLHFRKV